MNERYADIIVDITHEKLDRTFQYQIPPELEGRVQAGTRVKIPFGGGNRIIDGLCDRPGEQAEIRTRQN